MAIDNKDEKQLSNEELGEVNGGYAVKSVTYATEAEVQFKWNVGDRVEKIHRYYGHVYTRECHVLQRKADKKTGTDGYCAWYFVSSPTSDYNNKWFEEDDFENGYDSISFY